MKCTQCSAQITIEDEFCPYCGALNKAARQHMADMKKYKREFEKTKADVENNARRQTRLHSYLVALIIVAVLNIAVIVALMNRYELEDWVKIQKVNHRDAEYSAVLASYEAEGDYTGLRDYYRTNQLYYAKRGTQTNTYNMIYEMARYYTLIERNFYYLTHPQVDCGYSQSELLDSIATEYTQYIEDYNYMDSTYYQEQFSGQHYTAMLDMQEQMEAMLRTYGCLTQEDIENLDGMESAELMILIGRRMGIYE